MEKGLKLKDFASAQTYLIKLLSYRERSKEEVRQRLRKKGYAEEIIEKVINWAEENNLLNDLRFAKIWVKSKQEHKKLGKIRIAQELKQLGVDKETRDEVLAEGDEEEEYGRAKYWVSTKLKLPTSKIVSFLRRRGFGTEVINRVLKEFKMDKYEVDKEDIKEVQEWQEFPGTI